MATKAQIEATEARDQLRQWIKPGDTVYTVLRHVSRSGMMRAIDVYIIENGSPSRITWQVGKACGYTYNRKHEALTVNGCGMDMGFDVVYNLGYALWPEGFDCPGEKCVHSDHYNRHEAPEGTCADHVQRKAGACTHLDCKPWYHKGGGHAVSHRWM